jgi:hypothetical protein
LKQPQQQKPTHGWQLQLKRSCQMLGGCSLVMMQMKYRSSSSSSSCSRQLG